MSRISVLMATYNNANFLRECIDSVLSQTFDDFEFIIIDDASTDETQPLLESYQDSRIRLLRNPTNLKLSASLNRGLEIAQGDYIARIDADDVCLQERFEKQVAFLQSHPDIGALGTQVRNISPDGKKSRPGSPTPTTPNMTKWQALLGYPIAHPTLMIHRSLLDDIGGYDTTYPYAQDQALWSQLIFKTHISNLDEVLVLYRQHELSSLNRIKDKQQYELKARSKAASHILNQTIQPDELKRLYWSEIRTHTYKSQSYEKSSKLLLDLYTGLIQQEIFMHTDSEGLEAIKVDIRDRLASMAHSNWYKTLQWHSNRYFIAPLKRQVYNLRQRRLLMSKD